MPDWPSRAGAVKCPQPLRDAPPLGTLIALRVMGTCRPERKLPWEAISESMRRPWSHQMQVSSATTITAKSGHTPLAMLLLPQAPARVAISWLKCHHCRHFEAERVVVIVSTAAASGKDAVNAASLWPSHIRHARVTRVLLMQVMPRRVCTMPTKA